MDLREWLRPPRRALTVFLAMSLALSAVLGVAAWWLVRLDTDLERQRTRTRLERDVDLIVVSLRNRLNEIELELASLGAADAAGNPKASWLGPSSVAVRLNASGVNAWPSGRLAFYPNADASSDDNATVVRARALITEALTLKESGRSAAALRVYDQLAAIKGPALNDAPAELVARHARAALFRDLSRLDDARREDASLLKALRENPWRLSAGTYTYYAEQAVKSEPGAFPNQREALAIAVSQLSDAPSRRLIWIDRYPLVVITRPSGEGIAAFVGTAEDIVTSVKSEQGHLMFDTVQMALADTAGTTVLGDLPPPSADRIVRTSHEAVLPWSIYVSPAAATVDSQPASIWRTSLMLGAVLVGFCVLAGGWFTARAMHRELEVARIQSDFVSAVSHEFRTPVAAFEQLTELLVDGRVASEADRDEYYRRLHRESRRLRRLVEDLLDFRRMEAGAREFRFERTEVSTLVTQVVDEFAEERAVRPQITEMPKEPAVLQTDRESIGRALWNLLDNAAKYGAASPISVTVENAENAVRISVIDRGPGIPKDRHEEIFKRFVRANGLTAPTAAGTGLGLAMVRHIVRAHHGKVMVASEPGQGATFTIELPT